jgi:hypothetical protein
MRNLASSHGSEDGQNTRRQYARQNGTPTAANEAGFEDFASENRRAADPACPADRY